MLNNTKISLTARLLCLLFKFNLPKLVLSGDNTFWENCSCRITTIWRQSRTDVLHFYVHLWQHAFELHFTLAWEVNKKTSILSILIFIFEYNLILSTSYIYWYYWTFPATMISIFLFKYFIFLFKDFILYSSYSVRTYSRSHIKH